MPDSVTVSGDARAASMIRSVAERATHQRDTMLVAARETQRSIRGIPVATGRLERGVTGGAESTLDVSDEGFDVGTDVPYAGFVFGGTRTMPARPPRIPEVAQRVAVAVSNTLR